MSSISKTPMTVRDIEARKRPRSRNVIRADYVDTLRERAAANDAFHEE